MILQLINLKNLQKIVKAFEIGKETVAFLVVVPKIVLFIILDISNLLFKI